MLCETEWLVPARTGGRGREHPRDGGDGGRQGRRCAGIGAAEPRYRFASTLAHEVVYQNLLLRRRTELHQRAGTVLEGLLGTSPSRLEDLDALCHHFSRGEDRARGARYLVARRRLGTRHLCQRGRAALLRAGGGHPGQDRRTATSGPSPPSASTWAICWRRSAGARRRRRISTPSWRGPARPPTTCARGACSASSPDCTGTRASASAASAACATGCGCSSAAWQPSAATSKPTSSWPTCAMRWAGSRFGAATTSMPMSGRGARCCRPSTRQPAARTIRPPTAPRPWRSRTRSTRSAPRWPGSGGPPKRSG